MLLLFLEYRKRRRMINIKTTVTIEKALHCHRSSSGRKNWRKYARKTLIQHCKSFPRKYNPIGIPSETEAVCKVTQIPPNERMPAAMRKRMPSFSNSERRMHPLDNSSTPVIMIRNGCGSNQRNQDSIKVKIILIRMIQPQISDITLMHMVSASVILILFCCVRTALSGSSPGSNNPTIKALAIWINQTSQGVI